MGRRLDVAAPPPVAARRPAAIGALVIAYGLSAVGEAMTFVTLPWFVLQTTGSAGTTGLVLAVGAVTTAVVGFASGPVVDRLGLKRVAVLAFVVGGAAIACIPLLHARGLLDLRVLLGLVVVASALEAPGAVALSGLVPGIARDAGTTLERANAALQTIGNVSLLVGPALGGVAIALVGTRSILLLDAAACALAALAVAAVVREDRPVVSPPSGAWRYGTELRKGVALIRADRLLVSMLLTSTVLTALDSGLVAVVLVTYAYVVLGDAASLSAMVMAFGVGALAGSVAYGVVGHRWSPRRVYLVGTLMGGALLAVLAATPPFPLALAVLAAAGLVSAPIEPVRATVLQRRVPIGSYGRVVGVMGAVAESAVPLGIAAVAVGLGGLGLRWTIVSMAASYVLVVLVCWRVPAFHEMDARPGPPPGPPGRSPPGPVLPPAGLTPPAARVAR